MQRSTHWKRPWCWERLKAGQEEDDRGWDGWMASLTQWTWVWVNSGSWWWTERPGMLQSMGTCLSNWTEMELNWWVSHCRAQLFVTPWTVACQAPLSVGFPRQEYWSGLPFPSPGDLPDLGIEPRSPALQADALPSESPGKPSPVGLVSNKETRTQTWNRKMVWGQRWPSINEGGAIY